jgi:uncharacterized membrane protein (UPF0127 family)
MKRALATVLGAVAVLALYACGTTGLPAAQSTPTIQSTPTAAATATSLPPDTPTPAPPDTPTLVPAATSTTQLGPWVPPTALVGTPIPGAVATLTAAPVLKTGTVTITNSDGEEVVVNVEIADTIESRQLGLMFRSSMPVGAGMLFDFQGDTLSGFWMANTILPLSIAFIQADGTIIDTLDMQPLDTSGVDPSGTYRYALEVNQGFFQAHDIKPGDKMSVPVQIGAATEAMIPGMPRVGGGEGTPGSK